MVAIAPLFSLVALAISATATTMSNYSSKGCPGEGQVIHDPDHGGRCTQLDPNQAQSFKTTAVDPGCTVSVYSVANCGSAAVAAIGDCMSVEGDDGIKAYSIDC